MAVTATQKLSELRTQKPGSPIILIEAIDCDAVGDQITVTFDRPFAAAPKILGIAAISAVVGAANLFPAPFVKSVSTTAIVIGMGGIGTLTGTKINVLLQGDL